MVEAAVILLSSDARQDRKGSINRDKRNEREEMKAAGREKSKEQSSGADEARRKRDE